MENLVVAHKDINLKDSDGKGVIDPNKSTSVGAPKTFLLSTCEEVVKEAYNPA